MKDSIITVKRKKTEIIFMAACFAAAMLMNIGSIIGYKTPWYEAFTQIGFVVVITVVLYAITVFLRLVGWGVKWLFTRKKN